MIGRNEGERLRECIASCQRQADILVYVDSGSTDESVEVATSLGCAVVELDMKVPFTAGRARNAGISYLTTNHPSLKYVQLIDGDCILSENWLSSAHAELDTYPDVAVVCGRRRERYPEKSPYNLICDIEWDTPIGEAMACGGDALMRLESLKAVGGFDESFAAGEEPELCYRMRQRGWKVHRIDAEMTLHDANMTSFWQWWQRTKRSGSAYAQTWSTHGHGPEKIAFRDSARIWFWGGLIPLLSLVLAPFTRGFSLVILAAYFVLGWRVYQHGRQRGLSNHDAIIYGLSLVVGKFPQLLGQLEYFSRGQSRLIEYK